MKKLLVVVFVVMCLIGLAGTNAFAVSEKWTYTDLFGWGRVYDPVTGVPLNSNPYDGNAGTTLIPGAPATAGDGMEDSFTVARVSKISSADGSIDYWLPSATGQITVLGWGFDDNYLSTTNPINGTQTLGTVGGHIEIWYDPTPDPYNPALGTAGRSNPLDPGFYNTVTDSDSILLLALTPHPIFGNESFTETSDFIHNSFQGSMNLDVTGGLWAAIYNTNTQLDGSDFSYSWSSSANYPKPPGPGVADWLVFDDSTAYTTSVPEPATLLLLGMGLIGLGLARRYRRD